MRISLKKYIFLLIGLFVFIILFSCLQREIKESDKPLLITIDDFKLYGYNFERYRDLEKFQRTIYFDRSMEIEYEFETPDSLDDVLILYTTVTYERKLSDAILSYKLELKSLTIGIGIGGGKAVEYKDFFDFGNESYFAIIKNDSIPLGNLFITRKGLKIYSVFFTGLYFEDNDLWEEFINPKLQYFDTYKPE